MKFSVDINMHLGDIRGWGSSLETARLKIYKDDTFLAEAHSNIYREDVKNAGLHPTGLCGFSFAETGCDLVEGEIYKIEILTSASTVTVYRLYGDHKKMLNEFVHLELLPRNDLSHLEPSTTDILKSAPCIFAYKKLMIRLRRGKRGKQSRGEFIGYEYKHKDSDFAYFRTLTEKYLTVWTAFLDSRYLWSVVDTYADYGTPTERLAALAVSNYMYAERFHQTQHCLYQLIEKDDDAKVVSHQLQYWGGMKTNQLCADDALDVFLIRNLEILSLAPVIKIIFFKLLNHSSLESRSLLGMNLSNSEFFFNVYETYKNKFIN
jgi:hypothetical protein